VDRLLFTRHRIHHHGRQSPIAIEWVIEVVLDDGLFFLVRQPVIARDFSTVFVSFTVAPCPFIEGTAVDFGQPQDVSLGQLGFL
jgi:hypothetical protein